MKHEMTDRELRRLFVSELREEIAPEATAELMTRLHQERLMEGLPESVVSKWLGKLTICIVLASNFLVLYRIDVFRETPDVVYAMGAFVLGAFAAIWAMKRAARELPSEQGIPW